MHSFPDDWPRSGPIDLGVHDLPHASSSTEWWYVNAHLETASGRSLSLFASFFRIAKSQDPVTREVQYAHSLTWALSDPGAKKYWSDSLVDKEAPKLGLQKLERGEGAKDQRLRRAFREVLERGSMPRPDRMFRGDVTVAERKLALDYDGNTFDRQDDGSYKLSLRHENGTIGCDLTFSPECAPVRHGEDGVVRGQSGEDMFYYFVPRCGLQGKVILPGGEEGVVGGMGWYDHEFGQYRKDDKAPGKQEVGWNWCSVQLSDGTCISAYGMNDEKTGESLGRRALLIAADGTRHSFDDVQFHALDAWCSTRTFQEYPTRWRLEVPSAGISLAMEAAFEDQEFVTLISRPAFWEGRCNIAGHIRGTEVKGLGYVERSGFVAIDNLDDFFGAVGRQVRKSVEKLLPFDPTYEQVRDLIASKEREQNMIGVDLPQFARTLVKPVREITDRGGKSWRSYAALACCDVVGGDSRQFVQWLAMPELMHVGSLIVDDVQDKSTVRRGGPTCHMIYGEALAINAGTACYFLGQKMLFAPKMSAAEKLRIYDLYFESLRAGHAGQALDLDGLNAEMPRAVKDGGGEWLEERVLAVHRLKTAAPAASLARMGGVAGGGSEAQIEGIGRFFESVGLAFQIVDDVLNLRGFKGDLKSRGEDIAHGKVTLPVAKAMMRLPEAQRQWLWQTVESKPGDQSVVEAAIDLMETCGAIDACETQARDLVETAWAALDPLVHDSLPKIMLRAFGWYVLERHY